MDQESSDFCESQPQENSKGFLKENGFEVLPLTENIGQRAAVYVEEYSLGSGNLTWSRTGEQRTGNWE